MKKTVWNADWIPGLLVMLACLLLAETPQLRSLDWHAYDLGMRFTSDKEARDDIVVVAIDDESLRAYGAWPWSRAVLAEATRTIARARPRTIGFNLPFDVAQGADSLESIDKLEAVLKSQKALKRRVRRALQDTRSSLNADATFAGILHSAGRIVLAVPYVAGSFDETAFLPDYLENFALSGWAESDLAEATTLYPPIEVLSKQVSGIGAISAHVDPLLHSHRYPLVVRHGEDHLASFELMLAARHLGLASQHIKPDGDQRLKLGAKRLVTDKQYAAYPRFYPGETDQPAFQVISMADLLDGKINESQLRRKTIIVGLTSSQHAMTKMTPTGEAMSSSLIAAHTVSSLLNEENYLIPPWAELAQKLAILVVGLYLMFLLTRLRKTTGIFVTIFLLLVVSNAHFILMSSKSTWVPLMAAVLALVVGHFIVWLRLSIDGRMRRVYRELSDANRQLGVSFQDQGQFDQAFEKYRQCDVDDSLLGQLYNLGLDYERKRQFNKAESVFNFIQKFQANYSDAAERISRNKQASEAVVLGGGSADSPHATLILDNGDMQKPMLGRYQIDKEIGRGAMGMVYLGRDEKIGRTVAVKTMAIRDEIEPDKRDAVKARFFREAEAAGRLDHPNIVTVYDVGDEQDLAYIAMDFLKGKDLTTYCSQKKLLPVSTVFEIIMSVADALEYAHEQHVVHRDIKPANIIYNPAKKIAKITDFGVACLTDASKTKTGTVLGSPYYMSPEQLAGDKVDGRADIYSLGVTLYQLLAGELPFTSDSMANLMYQIANKKHPDIRSYRPDVPSCVSSIINRSLHKDIEKRFQSGAQMAAAMKRCYTRIVEDG